MSNPVGILIFKDANGRAVQHDPDDRVDYVVECSGAGLLETGETISSYTLSVRPEAAALGLTISGTSWAPSQPTTTSIKFWIEVDPAYKSNVAYDGSGQTLGIEIEVITSNTPPRRRQRTVGIQVVQQ